MKRLALFALVALVASASAQPITSGGLQRVVHGSSLRGNGNNTSYLDALPGSPFGTGFDGAVVFDGTTTILGMAPSSTVYTLSRDIEPSAMTVNVGVRIKTAGYRIFVSGTLTNNGQIDDNGADAATTWGAIRPAGFYAATYGGAQNSFVAVDASPPQPYPYLITSAKATGGSGGTSGGAGTAGGNGGTCQGGGGGGAGWSSGDGNGNGGATGGAIPAPTLTQGVATLNSLLRGGPDRPGTTSQYTYAAPAAGGRSSGGSVGGGGGGDGGIVFVGARTIAGGGSFQARGGAGGNAVATSSGHGGGGGGGGGPGGFVVLAYSTATGAWGTNVSGGTHGSGTAGNGGSTNAGGNGGDGGACYVLKFNLSGDGT